METLKVSNIVIYYNEEDQYNKCYIIGKIVDVLGDKYSVKPYFSLNEDKLFYKNKDVVIYKTDSGSGKYEIEKIKDIIKLRKIDETIFKYNYGNVYIKTLFGGNP